MIDALACLLSHLFAALLLFAVGLGVLISGAVRTVLILFSWPMRLLAFLGRAR